MPSSTKVQQLKINTLTESQYDAAVQSGTIGEYELSVLTDVSDKPVQVESLPTASVEELGNIYQYVGTTTQEYTNAYFYKCTTDGSTYAWEQVNVQPNQGGIQSVTEGSVNGTISVDGTDVNVHGLKSAAYTEATNYVAKTGDTMTGTLGIEKIAPGRYESATLLNLTSKTSDGSYISMISLSMLPDGTNDKSLQISAGLQIAGNLITSGSIGYYLSYPMRVCTGKLNSGGDYSYSNDITVPTVGGKLALQIDTMPAAAAKYLNVIYQFTGTTTSTYTNGHFYKCVSNGSTYSWEEVSFGGGAVIDDSTTSTTETWSSSKINSMIGDVESLLAAI